jgi:TRAP-type uncharacterized transport system fused permease subunit
MMLTWKYTLPAFLVPFVFTLSREGMGVLLQSSVTDVVTTSATAAFGVGALAIGAGGWLKTRANIAERLASTGAGLLLLYPSARLDVVGFAILAVVVVAHVWRAKSAFSP